MRVRVLIISMMLLISTALILQTENASGAEGVFVVAAESAFLYSSPNENGKTTSVLNRGRRVQASGPARAGYLPILTRSGTQAWLREADVVLEKGSHQPSASDVVEPRRKMKTTPRSSSSSSSPLGLHALTFDFGLSGGSYHDVSYAEANIGLNAYFSEWLAWRNAVFGRFPQQGSTTYGLDTSVRGILNLPILTAFAGPGYRFVTNGGSAPLVEGGLILKLGVLTLGGGMKVVMSSWAQSGVSNDTQYFLILGGGGSL